MHVPQCRYEKYVNNEYLAEIRNVNKEGLLQGFTVFRPLAVLPRAELTTIATVTVTYKSS